MNDFNKFYLNFWDITVLFFLRFRRKFILDKFPKTRMQLLKYGLIVPNTTEEKNQIGERIRDGTYSKADIYRDYSIHLRKEFYRSFFFPSLVAVITSLIVNALIG